MDPPRPPVPPRPTRFPSNASSDPPLTTAPFNSFYNMHVAAAAASPLMNHRANTSPASFYPSHLAQHVQLPRPSPVQHIHTAPSLPSILMPGGGPRRQNSALGTLDNSLFFHNLPASTASLAPDMPVSYVSPVPLAPFSGPEPEASSFVPLMPPIRSQQSSPLPLPERLISPKLPVHQDLTVQPVERPSTSQSAASPIDEDEELARVLKLSLQETGPVTSKESEDDILARVLKESLATAPPESIATSSVDRKGKQAVRSIDLLPSTSTQEPAVRNEDLRQKQLREDEELARALERQETAIAAGHPPRSSSLHRPDSSSQAEVSLDSRSIVPPQQAITNALPPSFEQSRPANNLYPQQVNHAFTAPALHQAQSFANNDFRPSAVPARPQLGRSASAQAQLPSYPAVAPLNYESRPVTSVDAVRNGGDIPHGMGGTGVSRMDSQTSSSHASSYAPSISSRMTRQDSESAENEGSPQMPVSHIEQQVAQGQLVPSAGTSTSHIEGDLLLGVTFGFDAPSISHMHEPMRGPIPHIITLPFSKAPPLHIQAPNWKQLLKLLTRLSESRIEPTIDALAETKQDLRLRTVIQFVKAHHLANDWRTIVYLSIDVPVPPQTANAHKYTNGDVTVFPYSYSTSPLPGILRAGAGESPMSKCFTVPTTATTPFPKLPLALPDFAMYLHSILRDSRRAGNDSTSGLRKLAKMVDSFYPQHNNPVGDVLGGADESEKRGVGDLFRRALGRERRKHGQSGGNADTYEFITPFRIDEYH